MEDLLKLFDIHFASRNTNSNLTDNLVYEKVTVTSLLRLIMDFEMNNNLK